MWIDIFLACILLSSPCNVFAECYGVSCNGWVCKCSSGSNNEQQCPVKAVEDGGLICPPSATSCRTDGSVRWKGPACQIGNVAIGKTMTMSSILNKDTVPSNCVDGLTFTATKICSTKNEVDAWLKIDLGVSHVIYSVKLWDRADAAEKPCTSWKLRSRKLEIQVTTENKQSVVCNYFAPSLCGESVHLPCPKPLIGSQVLIQHKNLASEEYLNLAEVEVIGFKYIAPNDCSISPTFGCMVQCHCLNDVCDYMTGICEKGCKADYIGEFCHREFRLGTAPQSTATTSNSISIKWTEFVEPLKDSARGPISVKYIVVYRESTMKEWKFKSEEPQILKNLLPNTNYVVAVRLQKVLKSGEVIQSTKTSPIVKLRTKCGAPLKAPQILRNIKTSIKNPTNWPQNAVILVSWKVLTLKDLRCDLSTAVYRIDYKAQHQKTWISLESRLPSISVQNLSPFTTYEFKVGVKNTDSSYVFGKTFSLRTASGVPGPVSNLSISEVTDTSLLVKWELPVDVNSDDITYIVSCRHQRYIACPSEQSSKSVINVRTIQTYFKLVSLAPFSEYLVDVLAESPSGSISKHRREVSLKTHISAPTGSPSPAIVKPIAIELSTTYGNASVNATFFDLHCQNMNGVRIGYNWIIRRKGIGAIFKSSNVVNDTITINDLVPYTEYVFTYRWFNSKGNSEESPPADFTTDESIPGIPVPIAVAMGRSFFTFGWKSPQPALASIKLFEIRCGQSVGNLTHPSFYFIRRSFQSYARMQLFENKQAQQWFACHVRASGKKGWGHWSHHVYFFTDGTEERFSVTLPSVLTAETTDTTMTLLMSSSKLESASAYMIAVKELNSLQRQRRQVTIDVKKDLWSYENAVKRGIKEYICAKFWSTLPDRFVVGDGKTYNNFLNPPLTSGKTYSIAFIVTTSFGKIIYRELGNAVVLKAHEHAFSAVKTPEVPALSAYGIVATALAAVFFVTVVILIAVLIFIYKKRRNIDRSIDKRNGSLAMQTLDNTSVDDGFQNSAFSDVADERNGQEQSGHYMVPDIQRTHSVIADNSRVSLYSAPYLHISSSRQSMIDPLDHHLDLDRHLDLDHPHYESPEILSTMTHTVENNYENNTSSVPRTRVNRLYSRPGISPEVNPPSDVSDRDINPYAISAHRRLSYDSNYEDLRLS